MSIPSSVAIEFDDVCLIVSGDFSPPQRGRHTLSNGDPGYPDEPAEFLMQDICLPAGTSLLNLLTGLYRKKQAKGETIYTNLLDTLEAQALEVLCDND